MKHILIIAATTAPRGLVEFCNAAERGEMFVTIANEIAIGSDGWAQLAPYGDFHGFAIIKQPDGSYKKKPAIQRVDQQAVADLVNDFASQRRGLSGFFKAPPIFIGHPDAPLVGGKYPTKEPVGIFANAKQDTTRGLLAEPIFTAAAEQLVAEKKVRQFSIRWGAEFVCEENGVAIFRPNQFLSAGLVERSNLPVEMLNNLQDNLAEAEAEAVTKQQKQSMKKKLLALVTALSLKPQFANASEPTDAESEAALGLIEERVATFANEQTSLKTKLLKLCGLVGITFANEAAITDPAATLAQVEEKVTKLGTDVTNARSQFVNERNAHIKTLCDTAITAGRITAAERGDWERRLGVEAQFANEVTALTKLEAKVKTTSLTLQRGERKVEISNASERREMVAELVNEEMENGKCNYDTAYARVQKKFPALFEAMQQPAIPGKK